MTTSRRVEINVDRHANQAVNMNERKEYDSTCLKIQSNSKYLVSSEEYSPPGTAALG
jgi:hypothetical protein